MSTLGPTQAASVTCCQPAPAEVRTPSPCTWPDTDCWENGPRAALLAPAKALPQGPYSVIVADPPWLYQKNPGSKGGGWDAFLGTAENVYPTMSNEALAAMPVRDIAAKDAHLFMWVTNPGLFGGRFSKLTPAEIAEAWGFRYVTLLTWVKTTKADRPLEGGMGWYFRGCTEHVLYAVRGKAAIHKDRRESNLIMAQRGRHSQKPESFMQMVERVTDGSRLELFAREQRPGWDSWGNQLAEAPLVLPFTADEDVYAAPKQARPRPLDGKPS